MLRSLLLSATVFVFWGCPSNAPDLARPIEEGEGGELSSIELLSTVNVADPRAGNQLLGGFHQLEQGVWRWTERKFSLILMPPEAVEGAPVALEFRFSLPEVVIDRVGAVTIVGRVNGVLLEPQTFAEPGDYFYTRELPPGTLSEEAARVEIELDRAMPPSDQDPRELGLVANSIAFK